VPGLVQAALEVIQQKYPTVDAVEQDRLARHVAAVARPLGRGTRMPFNTGSR
jgi:hypothetical protein